MKNSLTEQVRDLLLGMSQELSVNALDARRSKIIAIAEACKKTSIYRKTELVREEFYAPLRNVTLEKAILMSWVHFLERYAKAPSAVHKQGVIALCFPVLGDLLRKWK